MQRILMKSKEQNLIMSLLCEAPITTFMQEMIAMGNFEKGKNWRRKKGKHGRKRKVQGVTRKWEHGQEEIKFVEQMK